MATTEHFYTGNGSTTTYSFTFPYLKNADVKVDLDNVRKTETTHYTISNTNIVFGTAPANNVEIHIYRETDVDTAQAVFAAGSSIRAADLNNNQTQNIYSAQEQTQVYRTDKIKDNSITTAKILDGTIVNADISASAAIAQSKIATGALPSGITVASANIVDGTIVSGDIATGTLDSRYYTETELDAGQLDNRYYTETETNALFLRQDSSETIASGVTWSASDAYVATTAAIDARVIDLVDDVGGFVPIASETNFPTANPDVNNGAGTLVSIKSIGSTRTPSSGTVTIANGSGSNTVTITGCGSTVLTAGFGVIVETTTTLHTYTFHRLTPKATEVTTVAGNSSNITTVAGISSNVTTVAGNNANVTTVATNNSNINTVAGSIASVNTAASNITSVANFGDQYQVASSNPSTDGGGNALAEGDLYFNTTANELKVYNGSAWQGGVTASGNFAATTGNTFTGDNVYQDNAKIKLGTGSDLEIFHNASDSIINDAGTGNLKVQTGGNTKLEITGSGATFTGNITVSGNVDGRDVAADGTKLDGIESGATGDQTNAEIRTAVEAATDSNVFTDADHTKLNGIETSATADQTASEIVALVADQTIAPNVIDMEDNEKIKLGTGDDFEIYHDGTDNVLGSVGGVNISLKPKDAEVGLKVIADSGVELYFDNAKKAETVTGGFNVTGDMTATGNVTAYSDARLKTDIHTINDALGTVGKLRGVTYKWLQDGTADIGVIAQEVEEVVPEVVKTQYKLDINGETEVKSVDYGRLVSILINAVNELKKELDEHKCGGK